MTEAPWRWTARRQDEALRRGEPIADDAGRRFRRHAVERHGDLRVMRTVGRMLVQSQKLDHAAAAAGDHRPPHAGRAGRTAGPRG